MAKDFAHRFYRSNPWQVTRDYIIKSRKVCNRCGQPGECVHHIVYLTPENIGDPHVTLNPDNLELLCWSCHNDEHNSPKIVAQSGLRFDALGNLVEIKTPPGGRS